MSYCINKNIPVRMLFNSSIAQSSLIISNDESTKPRMYSFVIFVLALPVTDVEDMDMRKHCVLVQCNESDNKVKIIHTMIIK